MSYIIAKYAKDYYPDGRAPLLASIINTYTARSCGISIETYKTREAAEPDLTKLVEFNPSAGYGIVEVDADYGIVEVDHV